MRILGIDPGIGRTGWGVIDAQGANFTAHAYGCIETEANSPVAQRLQLVYEAVNKVIAEHSPQEFAIEELFFNTNAKTALIVGQARGVVLLAASQAGLPIAVYTPLQVKMALTGYGVAEKSQVGYMVKTLLRLPTVPKPDDTADALAIALSHSFSRKLAQRK